MKFNLDRIYGENKWCAIIFSRDDDGSVVISSAGSKTAPQVLHMGVERTAALIRADMKANNVTPLKKKKAAE